jgi:hypothetical protein
VAVRALFLLRDVNCIGRSSLHTKATNILPAICVSLQKHRYRFGLTCELFGCFPNLRAFSCENDHGCVRIRVRPERAAHDAAIFRRQILLEATTDHVMYLLTCVVMGELKVRGFFRRWLIQSRFRFRCYAAGRSCPANGFSRSAARQFRAEAMTHSSSRCCRQLGCRASAGPRQLLRGVGPP